MKNEKCEVMDPCFYGGLCLVAGTVFYFLSLGPVAYASIYYSLPPQFLDLYWTPAGWMAENDFAASLIGSYIELWVGNQCC